VHQVPAVVILVSGEAMAGTSAWTSPARGLTFRPVYKHQIVAKGDAHVVEIEVR
jgi:hypothetical protein